MSLGGCYSPTFPDALQCSPSRGCPGNQTCDTSGVCRVNPTDASPLADGLQVADAGVDASPPDAACIAVPGSQTFDYTGSIETFVIPSCVTSITIEAWGASGGDSYQQVNVDGGKGARMKGVFAVVQSNALKILVGGRGADTVAPPHGIDFEQGGGTGGGGSFVATSGDVAMLIAGGGGGCTADSASNGGDAVVEEPGQASQGGSAGGEPGLGGTTTIHTGGGHEGTGGGGFSGPGIGISDSIPGFGGSNSPGTEFIAGGAGGIGGESSRNGGFGGGGSAGFTGGGGGGYSGGGSGTYQTAGGGGGGAGSFNAGTEQDNSPGVQVGDGKIEISW